MAFSARHNRSPSGRARSGRRSYLSRAIELATGPPYSKAATHPALASPPDASAPADSTAKEQGPQKADMSGTRASHAAHRGGATTDAKHSKANDRRDGALAMPAHRQGLVIRCQKVGVFRPIPSRCRCRESSPYVSDVSTAPHPASGLARSRPKYINLLSALERRPRSLRAASCRSILLRLCRKERGPPTDRRSTSTARRRLRAGSPPSRARAS